MKNLLLLVATALALWLGASFWDAPVELFFMDGDRRVTTIPTADSYMTGTRTTKFGEDGSTAYVLAADTGLYYSGDDRFELQAPRLISSHGAESRPPWQLTAEIARSTRRGEQVILSGEVHAWQTTAGGRNEFFTDDIRFTPGDNTATTKARVKMVNPDGVTTGTGMKADFEREIYQLLADVRGYYNVR